MQILKLCFLVCSSAEVGYDLLKAFDQIITYRENIEFCAIVKAIQDHDFVIIERKVCKVDEFIKALDFLNVVEWEIEPFKVCEMADIFYFFDYVIV